MPKRRRQAASGSPGGPPAAVALAEPPRAGNPGLSVFDRWSEIIGETAVRPLRPEEVGDPDDPWVPFDRAMWDRFDELFNRVWLPWRRDRNGPFPLNSSDAAELHVLLTRLARWSAASSLRVGLAGRTSRMDDDRHFRMLVEYEETLPPGAPRAADAVRRRILEAAQAAMNGDPAWAPRLTLRSSAEPPRREPPTPLEAAAIRAERARARAVAAALANAPAAEQERTLAEYRRRVERLARLVREAEVRGEAAPAAALRALRLAEEWLERLLRALERAAARELREGGGGDAQA